MIRTKKRLQIGKKCPSLFFLCLLLLSPQLTQASSFSRLNAVYQRLLESPADPQLLYEYAEASIDAGNFETAIGALEGLLVQNSNQPKILFELGVLYQRLGSPGVAHEYLTRSLQLCDPAGPLARRIKEYLPDADSLAQKNHVNGVIRLGLRYQTNPTLSPESSYILSGGFNVPLPQDRTKESDVNGLIFSRIEHRYDLNPLISITSEAIFYGAAYADNTQYNTGVAELTTGPMFILGENAAGRYTLQPQIVLRGSYLDGALFEHTPGAGLEFRFTPGMNSWFTPRIRAKYQYRDVEYDDYDDSGFAPLRGGGEHRINLISMTEYTRGHVVQLGFFGRFRDAERPNLEIDQYDFILRYSLKINNYIKNLSRMTLTPYSIYRMKNYGAPDPDIAPDITREDREWRLGINYRLPVTSTGSILLKYEHTDADSNIINYEVKNDLMMISFQKEF